MKKPVVFLLLLCLACSLCGCGETSNPVLDKAPIVMGVAAGVGVLVYALQPKQENKSSETTLTDQLAGMLTSTEAAVKALGFSVNTTSLGFTSTHTRAITNAAAGTVTIQALADELATEGITLGGTTIEVGSLLTLLNAFIEAAYNLKESHSTDTRLLLPLYLVADSSGNLPASAPTLTAASSLSLEKAALLYACLEFTAKYSSSFTTAASVKAQAASSGLAADIAAEITGTPVSSGSFGTDAASLIGAYAGSLVGLTLATKASAALVLSTGGAAIPAVPYIYAGARVTGAFIGSRVATFVYKQTLGRLGTTMTQAEIDSAGKVLDSDGTFVTETTPTTTGLATVDAFGSITIKNNLMVLNVTAESNEEELVSKLPAYWKEGGVYAKIRGAAGIMKNRKLSLVKNTSAVAAYKVTYEVEVSATQEALVSWLFIVPASVEYSVWIATIESTGSSALDLRYSATDSYLAMFYLEHETAYANEYMWVTSGSTGTERGPLNGAGETVAASATTPWVTVYDYLASTSQALTFGWIKWSDGTAPLEFCQWYEQVRGRAGTVSGLAPGAKKTWIGMFSIHDGNRDYRAGQSRYSAAAANYQSIIDLLY